jgi:ElaB/YqjD/DUF883 family membrane-anchored ribosome-binding protein
MQKTKHKTLRARDYDLYADLRKITSAFGDATRDVKGKAAAIITESFDEVKDKTIDIKDTVTDYVIQRPLKSLGFATLAGLIVGYILHK